MTSIAADDFLDADVDPTNEMPSQSISLCRISVKGRNSLPLTIWLEKKS